MAAETASGYIQHHLQNLTYGQLPDGSWGFAHSAAEAKAMGFWAFHLDTLGWSVALGLIFLFIFRMAAKKATAGGEPEFRGAIDCAVKLMKRDGPLAFYKGFIPNFARIGSWNIIAWVTLEQLKKVYWQMQDAK